MEFVENVSKNEFIDFFNSFKYSHFLQSYAWGKAFEETRGKKAIYVGVKEDGKLIGAALLLKKEMPLGFCYYYCSRGYLIDFNNEKLLQFFTNELKKFLKRTHGIYLKINPEIEYQDIDQNANPIKNENNSYHIFKSLKKLGYKHKGFVKLYQNNEPRYSFRRYYKNYNSIEDINNSLSKSFYKTVKRSYKYNLIIDFDGTIDSFHELNVYNSHKDSFVQYSKEFYNKLYQYGKEFDNLLVINIIVNGKEQYSRIVKEQKGLKIQLENNQINGKKLPDAKAQLVRLEKEEKLFQRIKNNENVVVCSLINGIANDMMWTMYIGNNDIGEQLFAVNRVYYETIKYCFENNYRFLDLYGTVGDPKIEYKNLGGLHSYKSKFGDKYVEFIGEFDLINNKLFYYLLIFLTKIYRIVKKML